MQDKKYISRYISIIFRHSQVYIYNRLKQHGIGRGQQSIIMTLFDNGVMTQEQLARSLKLDKANIARGIDKLESEGYVRRERCENDKRSYNIILEKRSYEIRDEIISVLDSWADSLTKDVSEEEQQKALELLSKMVDNARNSDICNKAKEEQND